MPTESAVESAAFLTGYGITPLGIFSGVVAGALVQYLIYHLIMMKNRSNAKKIFRVEIQHNLSVLPELKRRMNYIKTKSLAKSLGDHDFYIDMRLFNYRASDTLLNNGWFHQIMSGQDMKDLFRFWVNFNQNMADQIHYLIKIAKETEDYSNIVDICAHWEEMCHEYEEKLSRIATRI